MVPEERVLLVRTWLVVAAEPREFRGILKAAGTSVKADWPSASFAREAKWRGDQWIFVANGPGRPLVNRMLDSAPMKPDAVISTGYCGALDPTLQVGDIVVSGRGPSSSPIPFRSGEILSKDVVVGTAAEKRELFQRTGAIAVEMEAAAVAQAADRWNVPFQCIRVVSDTAAQSLPMDFNLYRDAEGRFRQGRIALEAMLRPFSLLPELMRLDRASAVASQKLGDFFAASTF